MGGSGGGYFWRTTNMEELAAKTREAQRKSRSQRFETDLAKALGLLLANFNDRDPDATQVVFEQVKEDLADHIGGTIDFLFGGSVAKHTYVDGISDVDALVLLDGSVLAETTPNAAKKFLAERLAERYGESAVAVRSIAVEVDVNGSLIQLLPALRVGDDVKIASRSGDRWSTVKPRRFARQLTDANHRLGKKLVPCIKLVKAILAKLPDRQRLTGYHVEAMAVKLFADYEGHQTLPAMVRHFFSHVGNYVHQPIRDASGQSVYVDSYLGATGSLQRRTIGWAMDRVKRRIENADSAGAVDQWKDLFE